MSSVFETGLWGEHRAAAYLKRQGMRILEKRYRTPHGEIDLIAQDRDTLVFVEVKARPNGNEGDGLLAVNAKKRGHLRYAAQVYLRSVLTRCDIDIALFVDAEIGSTPTVDVVELLRVLNGPFLHIPNNSFNFSTLILIFS